MTVEDCGSQRTDRRNAHFLMIYNVLDGEAEQIGKRNTNFESTEQNLSTRYNNYTIRLRLDICILSYLLYTILKFRSLLLYSAPTFRLRRRRFYFGFLDDVEDFLRIKDKLAL